VSKISTFLLSMSSSYILSFAAPAQADLTPRLEDGLAITQPRIVETLSQRVSGVGVGLAYYLDPTGRSTPNLSNRYLSQLPAFQPILTSLRKEIAEYTQENDRADNTVGVGVNFQSRLFDMRFMSFDKARFVLVAVVNRPDKAFIDPRTCGETRLVYRLAYQVEINGDKNKTVVSRLPLTINLILNSKAPNSTLTCQEIAQRWKSLDVTGKTVTQAVDLIMGDSGPLAPELRDRSLIKQLEINLQLSRKAAAVKPDFGGQAIYLMKVYKWNANTQAFGEVPMDNQIDRSQARGFFAWLFDASAKAERLHELDRGTIQIPAKFLAMRAYTETPGEMSRAFNHVLSGTIADAEIETQLNSTLQLWSI
jgi:hypothetical protein